MTTPNSNIQGASAPEPSEVPGSGDRGIAQGFNLGGREFRVHNVDDRWATYGIKSFFGTFLSEDGEEVPKRYQLVVIDKRHPVTGKRIRMTLVRSPSYHYVPNEVAIAIADKVADEFGLHPAGEEYTSDGLAVYKRYVSDRREPVAVGDAVAIGFQLKNGVDGMVSHRYVGYTLRLVCTNGMIALRESTSFKVGSTNPIEIEEFVRGHLGSLLEGLQEELEVYREWTRITVNMRLANLLAAALPKNLLSSFVEFAPKSRAVVGVKPITVWEAFNRVTDPLTHRKIEARHRDWLRVRLSRAISVWQDVEAGRISEDEALERLGAGEERDDRRRTDERRGRTYYQGGLLPEVRAHANMYSIPWGPADSRSIPGGSRAGGRARGRALPRGRRREDMRVFRTTLGHALISPPHFLTPISHLFPARRLDPRALAYLHSYALAPAIPMAWAARALDRGGPVRSHDNARAGIARRPAARNNSVSITARLIRRRAH